MNTSIVPTVNNSYEGYTNKFLTECFREYFNSEEEAKKLLLFMKDKRKVEKKISLKYTNLENKVYLVKRSDGSIQDTCIISNGSIYLKDDTLRINNNFSSEPREKLNPGVLNDLQKSVHVTEFCEVNNIKLEIKLPYFKQSIIDLQEEHIREVLRYYNEKLSKFSKFLTEKYGDLIILS